MAAHARCQRFQRMFLAKLACLALLVCVLVATAYAEEPFRYPEGRHGKGEFRYVNNVPVLIVRGTPQEIGDQIGVLALKPAARIGDLVRGYVKRVVPEGLLPLVNVSARALYNRFPREYQLEVEATAAASGVDKDTLVLANTIIDLQEMIGCSSLLVASERSTTGGPLYGRNLDVPPVNGLAEFSLLIVYQPADALAFSMPNLPGFLMLCSGMNASGLALGSQSVRAPSDGSERFDPMGISSAVAGRRLMEQCKNVNDVHSWLQKNPLARCVSIAACDQSSQAVFEVTTKRVMVRKGDDGVCCATNHFRNPKLAGATQCARYDTLDQSRTSVERFDVAEVAKLMHAANQDTMTIHTMIFETKPLRLHIAMGPGPSSNRPLALVDLADLFKSQD
jgi:isopenicillin-N N-acyltransferase like protein